MAPILISSAVTPGVPWAAAGSAGEATSTATTIMRTTFDVRIAGDLRGQTGSHVRANCAPLVTDGPWRVNRPAVDTHRPIV